MKKEEKLGTASPFNKTTIITIAVIATLVISAGFLIYKPSTIGPISGTETGTGPGPPSKTETIEETIITESTTLPEPELQRRQVSICEGFNATFLTISENDFWIEMSIQDLLEKINEKSNGLNNHVVFLKKWPLRITNAIVEDISRIDSYGSLWLLLKMNQSDTSIPLDLRSPFTILVMFPKNKGWPEKLEPIQPGMIVSVDCEIDSFFRTYGTIDIHIVSIVDGYRLIDGNGTLIS